MARSSTPFEDFKATEKDDQENNQDLGVSFYKNFFLCYWHFLGLRDKLFYGRN
jgi:hypothetical protein